MELFKKRPLALCCFCAVAIMIIGLFMSRFVRILSIALLALALILAVIFLVILCKKKSSKPRIKNIICLILCIILSMILFVGIHSFVSQNENIDRFYGKTIHITGEVTAVRYKTPSKTSLEVNLISLDGEECNARAIFEIDSEARLDDNDKFSLVGEITGLSSDEYYLSSEGFNAKISCSSEDEISYSKISNKKTFLVFFKNINSELQDLLNKRTDEKTGALTGALLLGNRDNLRDETIRDFRRCGISHMLALSGLHMAIIIGAFDMMLRSLMIKKNIRCVILIALSLFYLALTGFSSSASRAVIMLCIVYILYLLESDAESVTSLFIALFVILAISPYSLFDIGLWMSFFATLGIIIISDIISSLKFRLRKKPLLVRISINLFSSVAVTLAAVFSVCVFTWLFFGEISILSPITNLVLSPIMTLILLLGLILIITAPINIVSSSVAGALVYLSTLFENLASEISHWRGIVFSLKYDFVPYIIIPLCISLAIFLLVKIKHKWTIVITPSLAVIAFIISINAFNNAYFDSTKAIYLRNKRNEALIVSTISEVSVCDISSGGYYDLYSACKEATSEHATEIENLILTHYHDYHPGAFQRICNRYMVRNVYLPEPENADEIEIFNTIVQYLGSTRVNKVIYTRGSSISVGWECFLSVSQTEYASRSKHPLFAVNVSNGTNLLTYATSGAPESRRLASDLDKANILILGSHGATIKPLSKSDMYRYPQTLIFSSPDDMLKNKDFVSYLNILYQQGHEIIFDTSGRLEFNISKQTD